MCTHTIVQYVRYVTKHTCTVRVRFKQTYYSSGPDNGLGCVPSGGLGSGPISGRGSRQGNVNRSDMKRHVVA